MHQVKLVIKLCVILCLVPFLSDAQGVQFSFHHLDQEDGLPLANNYHFFQDSRGFVWIGTMGGLCRFDGQDLMKFSHDPSDPFSLPENQVTSRCFEDKNGDLWFTTFSAVNYYRRATGHFDSWSLTASGQKDYYAFDFDSTGKVWLRIGVGKEASMYWFDTKTKEFQRKINIEGNLCSVLKAENGTPSGLIETDLPDRAGLIYRSLETGEGGHYEFLKTSSGEERLYSSPTKTTLADANDLVWVGIYNGIGVFDPSKKSSWIEQKRLPDVPEDIGWTYGIVRLDSQNLLVSCTYGLLVFDKVQRVFTQLLSSQPDDPLGLSKSNYEKIYLDTLGNLWLSKPGTGLTFAHLKKRKFQSVPLLTGKRVTTIFEEQQGRIWCSTMDDGTYVFDVGKKLLKHTKALDNRDNPEISNLPNISIFVKDAGGRLWGIVDNNLLLWDGKKGQFTFRLEYFLGVPNTDSDKINAVISLYNGDLLAAKGSSVFRLLTSVEKVELAPWYDLSVYNLQVITAIFQDQKNRIYIADHTERLLVFNESTNSLRLIAEMKGMGACNSFLEMGDSIVYTATSKGLLKIETANWQYRQLDYERDSVPNEVLHQVLADKNGWLWLSGNDGLIRYDPLQKQVHRFNVADGLASQGTSPNGFIVSSSGEFWLGTKKGLNVFEPTSVHLMNSEPPVHITQILVNDTLYTQNKGETSLLDFDYRHNTLSFRFAALDFSDPGSNAFYYRLRGYEDEWVYNGTEGFVRYPNLPPGNYAFEVKATNSDGILGEKIQSLRLHIQPPFWQTWWFYLLCFLVAIGIVWAWSQYRLLQAVKMERLRVKISSDLHDEVGTLLSGLAMQTEVLELTARQEDKPKLVRIAELSRSAMLSMRDTVWAIDARKDKFENLLDRIREHAEETLTPKNFRFNIHVNNVDLKKNLPVDVRQNLYLIFKEATTNIAKHSNGDTVLVRISRSGNAFEMHIHDNGSVSEKAYKTTGLGLSNMKLRTERIGGSIEISRNDGFNVRVRVNLP